MKVDTVDRRLQWYREDSPEFWLCRHCWHKLRFHFLIKHGAVASVCCVACPGAPTCRSRVMEEAA